MPRTSFFANAPLFEQLTENSQFAKPGQHTLILLTKEQLLDSVIKELENIFNTHSSYSSEDLDTLLENAPNEKAIAGIPGVLGLPSLPNTFVEDTSQWDDFAEKCALMIRLYEPRLADPVVDISGFDPRTQALQMNISGTLICAEVRETVSFPLPVMVSQG